MLPTDSPWSGLDPGGPDTRRVDASARWDWFWAVMPRADAVLLLNLTSLPRPLPELPKLRNLEVKFQTLPAGPILYIRLKDSSQLELFETLCRDVIAAGEMAATEPEAVDRAIARTFRWHYLLRGGTLDVLSEEAQKGLIGEIEVLKLLIDRLGATAAMAAWTGPSGAPKDFELRGDCIEVKARRGASQPFVKITSEFQLAEVPDRALWLAVLAVDRVQTPHGRTLTEVVAGVTSHLERTEASTILQWEIHLADAGFDSSHDYASWRWVVGPPEFYGVAGEFPRVASPVPLGVSGLSYSLALSACVPFLVEREVVQRRLDAEVGS